MVMRNGNGAVEYLAGAPPFSERGGLRLERRDGRGLAIGHDLNLFSKFVCGTDSGGGGFGFWESRTAEAEAVGAGQDGECGGQDQGCEEGGGGEEAGRDH